MKTKDVVLTELT